MSEDFEELEKARLIVEKNGYFLFPYKEDRLAMLEREAKEEGMSLSEYIGEIEKRAKEEGMTVNQYISYLDYLASDARAVAEEEKELNEIYGYKPDPDELPYYRC